MTDRSVTYRLRADITNLRAQMGVAAASVKGAAGQMTAATKESAKFREGLTGLGTTAGKVGLVAAGGLAVVVASAANFDSAMSKVQAATHESAANMSLLRTAAIQAGQDTKYSASEAAEGIEALAKAGVSTKDILAGGLSGALSLAAAGNQSVADSAETAASAMTQFHLAGKDIPHIADLLAAGAGKAQGEVSDLAMALNQTGLVASQTGLSIEEATAGLSAFASAGLIGSDAGTSFKTMLLRLTPTSDKAAALMDKLGLSAYDSQGQFIGLANYAGVLHDRLRDMSAQQRQAALQTIFGQDAIRAANVLYEQGAKGITAWTNKVDAQGYAAQTAGIKMDNLKGDLEQLRGSLETFFITTGEGGQGPLRGLTQHLTSLINLANQAPGPVKEAALATLALTAAVGGLTFAASRTVTAVANTRRNIGLLRTQAAGATTSMLALDRATLLRGAGKGALLLGGLAVASTGAADGIGLTNTASLAMAGSLIGPWGTAVGGAVGLAMDWKASIDADRQSMSDFNDQIDALATGGKVAQLKELSNTFHGLGDKSGGLVGDLANQLGDKAAGGIAKAKRHVDDLTASQRRAAAAAGDLGHKEQVVAKGALAAQKAFQEEKKAATETAQSFVGLGNHVNDSKVSLSKWIAQMRQSAEALKNFRLNAETAAKKGLDQGLIASLEKAGPEGALRMKQLANGTKEQIARANDAWQAGQRQVKLYTAAVAGVPDSHTTILSVKGAAEAYMQVKSVSAALNALHDKTVTLTTVRATGGHSVAGDAEGGTIPGQRYPYGDKVLRWLAPGEEVITNRHGEADRFRADRAAGRIPRYANGLADGGTVHASASDGVGTAARATSRALRGLNASLAEATKGLDREKQHRDNLVQAEQSLASSVTDTFRTQFLGATGNPWGASSSPFSILRANIRDARRFKADISALKRRGISSGLASQIDSLAAADQLRGMSKAQLHRLDHLYGVEQQVSAHAGRAVGVAAFGSKLDNVEHAIDKERAEVIRLRHEVTHLRKEQAHHVDRTVKGVGKAVNGPARTARRRGRP